MTQDHATYSVIVDGNVILQQGGDIDAEYPIDVSGINLEKRAILSFMLKAENPDKLKFKISIANSSGSKTIYSEQTSTNTWRVWQEVLEQGILAADDKKNKLKIEVVPSPDGSGRLVLSDIVLWYKLL